MDQASEPQAEANGRPELERPSVTQLRAMPIFAELEDRVLSRSPMINVAEPDTEPTQALRTSRGRPDARVVRFL